MRLDDRAAAEWARLIHGEDATGADERRWRRLLARETKITVEDVHALRAVEPRLDLDDLIERWGAPRG